MIIKYIIIINFIVIIYSIMKIKSGYNFTLLLTDRGEVYSWGNNNCGQLGIGTIDKDYHKPTKIEFSLGIPIRYISVGMYHAAAIDFDYNVYIWGNNEDGQLGLGDRVDRSSPTIIEYLTEKKIEKIYCKHDHTFALTQNGQVYSWGFNDSGNLGLGNIINEVNTPTKINFPNNTIIKKIYVGNNHIFAIDTLLKIYSWGKNNYYQLCNNNNIQQNLPSIANMLEDFNIEKIICLTNCTIILADNKLYSIGLGHHGELGLSKHETHKVYSVRFNRYGEYGPTPYETNKITMITEGVEKVWGNDCTVFCKMTNGDIYAWGLNFNGQLGIGNKKYQKTPFGLNIDLDIKSINYYCSVTYAITTSGEIYTWGSNELVNKKSILKPTLFTYFPDNEIEIKTMSRSKSARKN